MMSVYMNTQDLTGVKTCTKFEKDDEGYYKIPASSYNIWNRDGEWWPWTDEVSKAYSPGTTFYTTMVNDKQLFGEGDHPMWDKGMTESEFIARNLIVDGNKRAFHIRDMEIKDIGRPDAGETANIIVVYIWIKPIGEKKELMIDLLETCSINAGFSSRVFSRRGKYKGRDSFTVTKMITWDSVPRQAQDLTSKDGLNRQSKKVVMTNRKLKRIVSAVNSGELKTQDGDLVASSLQELNVDEPMSFCDEW